MCVCVCVCVCDVWCVCAWCVCMWCVLCVMRVCKGGEGGRGKESMLILIFIEVVCQVLHQNDVINTQCSRWCHMTQPWPNNDVITHSRCWSIAAWGCWSACGTGDSCPWRTPPAWNYQRMYRSNSPLEAWSSAVKHRTSFTTDSTSKEWSCRFQDHIVES